MALLFGRHCSMQCKKKVERGSSEVFVTTLSQRAIAGKRRICVPLCKPTQSFIEFHRISSPIKDWFDFTSFTSQLPGGVSWFHFFWHWQSVLPFRALSAISGLTFIFRSGKFIDFITVQQHPDDWSLYSPWKPMANSYFVFYDYSKYIATRSQCKILISFFFKSTTSSFSFRCKNWPHSLHISLSRSSAVSLNCIQWKGEVKF